MPAPGGAIGNPPPVRQISASQLIHPVQLRFVATHVDEELDLALLILHPGDAINDHWSFQDLAGNRTLKPGHSLVLAGYPAARAYNLRDGSRTASPNIDFPTILPQNIQHRDLDSKKHLLVDFPSANDFDPHGYSGGPVWYNIPPARTRDLWVPNPGFAGMVISYLRKHKALIVVKRKIILKFLAAAPPLQRDPSSS